MKFIGFFIYIVLLLGCEPKSNEPLYHPVASAIENKVYLVGIHPYINTQQMFASYRPILDYLESKIPQTTFKLETSQDYTQYNKKLASEVFDFSLPNPYQTINSFQYGYSVIAKMKPDTTFKGIFVARKSSHLKKIDQLKGHSISFPAPTALAAAMMPLYFLKINGLDIEKDIEKRYVGSQFSSIMNAYSGDTIAGATWPTSWKAWCEQNPDKKESMEVVWQTDNLVNNGFIIHYRVPKEIAYQVAVLLSELDMHDEGKKLLDSAGFDGFELSTNSSYDKVSTFLKEYDKAIGLPK